MKDILQLASQPGGVAWHSLHAGQQSLANIARTLRWTRRVMTNAVYHVITDAGRDALANETPVAVATRRVKAGQRAGGKGEVR